MMPSNEGRLSDPRLLPSVGVFQSEDAAEFAIEQTTERCVDKFRLPCGDGPDFIVVITAIKLIVSFSGIGGIEVARLIGQEGEQRAGSDGWASSFIS
jgi:hypothetical protein